MMNYPKMKIFLVLSISFALLAVALGQTLTYQLRGNLTLGGIGNFTNLQDIINFENFLNNYTTSYYVRQTDGMVTNVSVSVKVTNSATLLTTLATYTRPTISFDESISYRATNSTLNYVMVASRPITNNSKAFLNAIPRIGGPFVKVFQLTMSWASYTTNVSRVPRYSNIAAACCNAHTSN
jgi:hypothetical protein